MPKAERYILLKSGTSKILGKIKEDEMSPQMQHKEDTLEKMTGNTDLGFSILGIECQIVIEHHENHFDASMYVGGILVNGFSSVYDRSCTLKAKTSLSGIQNLFNKMEKLDKVVANDLFIFYTGIGRLVRLFATSMLYAGLVEKDFDTIGVSSSDLAVPIFAYRQNWIAETSKMKCEKSYAESIKDIATVVKYLDFLILERVPPVLGLSYKEDRRIVETILESEMSTFINTEAFA